MKDPRRLADETGSGLETRLLRHAREERPPDGNADRVLAALGIGTAAATAGTMASGAAAGSAAAKPVVGWLAGSVAKWIAIGSTCGVAAIGAAVHLHARTSERDLSTARAQSHVERSEGLARAEPGVAAHTPPAALRDEPGSGADQGPAALDPASRAPAARPAPQIAPGPSRAAPLPAGVTGSQVEPGAASIELEIAHLDRARAALQAGHPAEALSVLGSYDRQFGRGALAPEAQFVRIQALLASGRREAALERAQALLRSDPTGPHAARIRELLARSASPGTISK